MYQLFLSSWLLLLFGCGGSSARIDSPDAVAKALLDGLITGDKTTLNKLFATKEDINASFDCTPEGMSKMMEEVAEEKKTVMENADRWLQQSVSKANMRYAGFEQRNEEVIPAGTEKNGCTTKNDVSTFYGDVTIKFTNGGLTRDDVEDIVVLRLNGRYFFWSM